ncbi:conserved hypothethical protein (plasmid) [Ralstonia solanacearum PSI07]|nr:conserved hypothethical protein [Ralstonia solanacearum PSI07]
MIWLVTAMPFPIQSPIGRREAPVFRLTSIFINKTGHKGTFVPILMRLAGVPDLAPA